MLHVRRNDTVKILVGKDKGKTGKVLKVFPGNQKAIIQGANFIKKHAKRTRQDEKAGIIQRESPVNISNLAVVCKGCNRITRIGRNILKDGSKVRYCKKCNEIL